MTKVQMTLRIAQLLKKKFPGLVDVDAVEIAHAIVEAITNE
jgi:hypothetical protein